MFMFKQYEYVVLTQTILETQYRNYLNGPRITQNQEVFTISIPSEQNTEQLAANQQLRQNFEIGPISKIEIAPNGYIVFDAENTGYFLKKSWIEIGLVNHIQGKTLVLMRDTTANNNIHVISTEDWQHVCDHQNRSTSLGKLIDFQDWKEGATYKAFVKSDNQQIQSVLFKFIQRFECTIEEDTRVYLLVDLLKSSFYHIAYGYIDLPDLISKMEGYANIGEMELIQVKEPKKVSNEARMCSIYDAVPMSAIKSMQGTQQWVPVSRLSKLQAIPTGPFNLRYKGNILPGVLIHDEDCYRPNEDHFYWFDLWDTRKTATLTLNQLYELTVEITQNGPNALEENRLPAKLHNAIPELTRVFALMAEFIEFCENDETFFEQHRSSNLSEVYPHLLSRPELQRLSTWLEDWELSSFNLNDVYRFLGMLMPNCEVKIIEVDGLKFII